MGAPGIGQVLRATLIADYKNSHLERLPPVPTVNIQRMNVWDYAHHIVAVSDEFQSHRSQKKTGAKTPIWT